MLKRKEGKEVRKYEKRQLVSSLNNSQLTNPLKKADKERRFSVKSSEILEAVKVEIFSEFRNCTSIMRKISDELFEVEKWL